MAATWALSAPCCYRVSALYQQQDCHTQLFSHKKRRSLANSYGFPHPLFASSPSASPRTSDTQCADDAQYFPPPGFSVVERFYAGVNSRDFDSVGELMADDCIYEDLVFPQPFVGRKAIIEFLSKFMGGISSDFRFAIDYISRNDPSCIGVTWHLEWRGKPFPFSKGCSFYRLTTSDGKQQIIYARDSVEPAVKPGDAALVIIKAVGALLERFPKLADRL